MNVSAVKGYALPSGYRDSLESAGLVFADGSWRVSADAVMPSVFKVRHLSLGSMLDEGFVISGSVVVHPTDPVRLHYRFQGWSFDGAVVEDTDAGALWGPGQYPCTVGAHVDYSLSGAQYVEGPASLSVTVEDELIIRQSFGYSVPDGFAVVGNYSMSGNVYIPEGPMAIPGIFSVKYTDADLAVSATFFVTENSVLPSVPEPVRDLYDFAGWDGSGPVTEDTVLHPLWTPSIYEVVIGDNIVLTCGGVSYTGSVYLNTEDRFTICAAEGYELPEEYNVPVSIILYGDKFGIVDETTFDGIYKIIFLDFAEDIFATISVVSGSNMPILDNAPTTALYDFEGWEYDSVVYSDIINHSLWIPKIFTFTMGSNVWVLVDFEIYMTPGSIEISSEANVSIQNPGMYESITDLDSLSLIWDEHNYCYHAISDGEIPGFTHLEYIKESGSEVLYSEYVLTGSLFNPPAIFEEGIELHPEGWLIRSEIDTRCVSPGSNVLLASEYQVILIWD